jgi:hypothetical protein
MARLLSTLHGEEPNNRREGLAYKGASSYLPCFLLANNPMLTRVRIYKHPCQKVRRQLKLRRQHGNPSNSAVLIVA